LPRFVFNVLVKQQEDESDWFDERKLSDMLVVGTWNLELN